MKYRTKEMFIDDIGLIPSFTVEDKWTETAQEELLWHLNDMRSHDNLEPLSELPEGFEFEPIFWNKSI